MAASFPRPRRSVRLAATSLIVVLCATAVGHATPIESFRLDHPGAGPFPRFGRAAELDGDRMLVTAPGANDGIGSAYVYAFDGSTWNLEATLDPGDAPAGARFGESGAIRGDYVLIGAPEHDGAGEDSGAAYVFKFDGSSWNQTRFVTSSDIAAGDRFGHTVAIGNGFAVVGAPMASTTGRLYTYFPGDRLVEVPIDPSPETGITERFGYYVEASGPRILASALDAESAALYVRSDDQWLEERVFEATVSDPRFVSGVSIDGPTALLALHEEVLVIELLDGTWTETARLRSLDEDLRDSLGSSAAVRGDRIVANYQIGGGALRGLSWTRLQPAGTGEPPTWILDSDFRPDDDASAQQLAIAIDDDRIVFGAPSTAESQGAVFGFALPFCRRGNVTLPSGKPIDVLFVNGSAGDVLRRVFVEEGDAIVAAITDPPAGGNGRFFVHANAGSIDVTTPLPFDIGGLCFPVLANEGATPLAVWNNLGRRGDLGISQWFGDPIGDPAPAPTIFLNRFEGDPIHLPTGTSITLQGAIVDPSSNASKPIRTTNAVTLEVL